MQNIESENEKVNLMQKGKHDKEFKWLNEMATDLLGDGDAAGKLSGSTWGKRKQLINRCLLIIILCLLILKGQGRDTG